MKKVLIDNGHGAWTAGKRSPDGRLREGVYAREMAHRVAEELQKNGIPYELITPENADISLATRVYRANKAHKEWKGGTILISLHSDAVANGGWGSARGMSVRVSLNASQNSKTLARCFYSAWESRGMRTRKYNGDAVPYWPQNLAICRDTNMPAVLVEMFFHTSREDVAWAMSTEGKSMLANAITDAISKFLCV